MTVFQLDKYFIITKPWLLFAIAKHITAVKDTWPLFKAILDKIDANDIAHNVGVALQEKHTIVPHVRYHSLLAMTITHLVVQRIGLTLEDHFDSVPSFSDQDSWYLNVCLAQSLSIFLTDFLWIGLPRWPFAIRAFRRISNDLTTL